MQRCVTTRRTASVSGSVNARPIGLGRSDSVEALGVAPQAPPSASATSETRKGRLLLRSRSSRDRSARRVPVCSCYSFSRSNQVKTCLCLRNRPHRLCSVFTVGGFASSTEDRSSANPPAEGRCPIRIHAALDQPNHRTGNGKKDGSPRIGDGAAVGGCFPWYRACIQCQGSPVLPRLVRWRFLSARRTRIEWAMMSVKAALTTQASEGPPWLDSKARRF